MYNLQHLKRGNPNRARKNERDASIYPSKENNVCGERKKAGNSFAGKDRKYRILIGKTLENVLPANTDLNQIKTRDRININNQTGIKIKWAEHYSQNSSNKREYQRLHVLERATTNTPILHLNEQKTFLREVKAY
ncbi:hypothetical protein BB561_005292 [Smittium simulii]|uniref:Uncharacterized protein n=1 Tax=Smittium simulii TaxID=133385 RepID=A0A2T9YB80_9FUNG|nr:hypothetical protein BB561_005292 [Smittium simulii]